MISRPKSQSIIIFIFIFTSNFIGCSNNNEETQSIQNDIIGTWSAIQDEEYNIYEFHNDGTGLLRDSTATYYELIPFTYSFVENNKIEFSAQEGYSIFVELTMPTPNHLSWDADVTGGYHIDFDKVNDCEQEGLKNCILGRWMHYWPDGNISVYDFRESFESSVFSFADEESTIFTFEIIDANSILFKVEDAEPVNVDVIMHNNYRMTLDFPDDKGESITVYRLDD